MGHVSFTVKGPSLVRLCRLEQMVGDREPHGRTGLILFWGGGGDIISLPDRFAYTVHINNFVRDFIRAFFKDFSVGGGEAFFEKGLSCEIIY